MYRMYGMWVVAWMPRNPQMYRMYGMPRAQDAPERQVHSHDRTKARSLAALGMTKPAGAAV